MLNSSFSNVQLLNCHYSSTVAKMSSNLRTIPLKMIPDNGTQQITTQHTLPTIIQSLLTVLALLTAATTYNGLSTQINQQTISESGMQQMTTYHTLPSTIQFSLTILVLLTAATTHDGPNCSFSQTDGEQAATCWPLNLMLAKRFWSSIVQQLEAAS